MLTRHKGGFWVVALIVLIAWAPGMEVTGSVVSTPHQLSIAPTSGSFPLTVRLSGRIEVHDMFSFAEVRIHWGDGEIFEYNVSGFEHTRVVDTTKVYSCPGLYRVIRERETYYADGSTFTFVDSNTVVTVSLSLTSPLLTVVYNGLTCALQTDNGLDLSRIDRTTVDWGDGSPPQDFTWRRLPGHPRGRQVSPPHTYASAGDYTAVVKHYYPQTCVVITSSTTVQIRPVIPPQSVNVTVSPVVGTAPLNVTVQGTIDTMILLAVLDYGDGSSQQWQDNGRLFGPLMVDVTHEYTCPASYAVEMRVLDFDGTWRTANWTVTPSQPPTVVLVPVPGDSVMAIRIRPFDPAAIEGVDQSFIDWGDGNPPEEFTWTLVGTHYLTPPHTYAAIGSYRVTVRHYYVGEQCSFPHESSISVEITGTPTAVEESTWGRIKSIYAD